MTSWDQSARSSRPRPESALDHGSPRDLNFPARPPPRSDPVARHRRDTLITRFVHSCPSPPSPPAPLLSDAARRVIPAPRTRISISLPVYRRVIVALSVEPLAPPSALLLRDYRAFVESSTSVFGFGDDFSFSSREDPCPECPTFISFSARRSYVISVNFRFILCIVSSNRQHQF